MNETTINLAPNMAFATYKYDTIFYHSKPENPLYYYWVGFEGEECEKILSYIGFSRSNPTITLNNPTEIIQAFKNLFSAWKTRDKYLLFAAFFHLLCTFKKNNVLKEQLLPEERDTIFSQAVNYIKNNVHRNIPIKELAEYLHVNQSYFTKIFKEHFKISPHAYIIRARLQQAEFLIKTTDKTISEISEILNYTDVYSFSKLFKKIYKLPPNQYRKNLPEKNKEDDSVKPHNEK